MRWLISELVRRGVLRVAGVYLGVSWALIQVAGWMKGALQLPANFDNIVFAVLAIGFVPTMIVTWVFDITVDGIRRTRPPPEGVHHAPTAPDWALAAVLAGVLAVSLAQTFWPRPLPPPQEAKGATPPTVTAVAPAATTTKLIAVLPFDNLSPEVKDGVLVDGLTDEIRGLLGKRRSITVISRQTAEWIKAQKLPVFQIGKLFGVTHVLEGNVKRDGDLYRIAAEMIDVATDTPLWRESYDAKLDRFFAIQDRIGAAIASALNVEFDVAAAERAAPTSDTDAYRLFLNAGNRFRSREKNSVDEAIDMYQQAVGRDPDYAEAYAGLAAAYFTKGSRLNTGYQKIWGQAQTAAEKARKLKPDLAQPYAVLGALARQRLDWEEAFTNGLRSVDLNRSDPNARLWLGLTQFFAGHLEEAHATLAAARRLEPVYGHIHLWQARLAFARGDDEAGIALSNKLIESGADYRGFGYWYLAYIEAQRGHADLAEKNYRAAVAVWKTGEAIADHVVKALQKKEPAVETVAALLAEAARDPDFAPEQELLLIGQEAAFIDALKARLARGDTDGFNYYLNFLWRSPGAGGEAFRDLVRSAKLVDFWRKDGWPDKCRAAEGDDFICE